MTNNSNDNKDVGANTHSFLKSRAEIFGSLDDLVKGDQTVVYTQLGGLLGIAHDAEITGILGTVTVYGHFPVKLDKNVFTAFPRQRHIAPEVNE